jgi:hypothetical protein
MVRVYEANRAAANARRGDSSGTVLKASRDMTTTCLLSSSPLGVSTSIERVSSELKKFDPCLFKRAEYAANLRSLGFPIGVGSRSSTKNTRRGHEFCCHFEPNGCGATCMEKNYSHKRILRSKRQVHIRVCESANHNIEVRREVARELLDGYATVK